MSRAIFIAGTFIFGLGLGGGELTFPTPVEAMRKAVERLPPMKECTPADTACEKMRNYREALKDGQPLVLGTPTTRGTTVLFALELEEAERNEWLRQCLRFLTEPGFRERFKRLKSEHRGAVRNPYTMDSAASCFEAIYNLATDEALKTQALAVFTERAASVHDESLREHETSKDRYRQDSRNGLHPRPTLHSMKVWDLEKIRKEAGR